MHSHQLLNEGDLKDICVYCGKDVNGGRWCSEFLCNAHYKTLMCSCGRMLSVRVDFLGDGNDSWSGISCQVVKDSSDVKDKKTLEKVID